MDQNAMIVQILACNAHGIEMPYSQRVVHIKPVPA